MKKQLCLIFIFIFFVAGCGKQDRPVVIVPAAPEGAVPDIVKIGSVMPETGVMAPFGQSSLEAIMLAFEEINAAGGVLGGKHLVLKNADNRSKAEETSEAFRWLLENEEVVAVIGPVTSSHALTGAPLAQQARIPTISPSSFDPAVTLVGDYIFRACFTDPFQGRLMAGFALEKLNVRTAAVMVEQGSRYARGLADCFTEYFEAGGGTIVYEEIFSKSEKDFSPILAGIIASGAEFVYIPSYYDTVAPILRQARDMVVGARFGGGDGWDFPELIQMAGEAAEGGYFTTHYSPDRDAPETRAFVTAYQAKYGKVPDTMAALAYDAACLLARAIDKAGSTDGEAIRDALASITFTGVTGTMVFDENRNPIKEGVVKSIENQKPVYKATVSP